MAHKQELSTPCRLFPGAPAGVFVLCAPPPYAVLLFFNQQSRLHNHEILVGQCAFPGAKSGCTKKASPEHQTNGRSYKTIKHTQQILHAIAASLPYVFAFILVCFFFPYILSDFFAFSKVPSLFFFCFFFPVFCFFAVFCTLSQARSNPFSPIHLIFCFGCVVFIPCPSQSKKSAFVQHNKVSAIVDHKARISAKRSHQEKYTYAANVHVS